MIDVKIDKINSLYQNVQNNFTRLDFSLFGEQINVQEDDVSSYNPFLIVFNVNNQIFYSI